LIGEKKIYYQSKDKIKLCGIFSIPDKMNDFVLLTHGITMDKNEYDDFYKDVAKALYTNGIGTFRFDYRAHGESEGKQREMTIIGELIDIESSMEKISEVWKKQITIMGTSFGAGSSILYTALYPSNVKNLILLSPVLDYNATFIKPVTPWGKDNFNNKGFSQLKNKGYMLLDGEFELGVHLIEEFRVIKPYEFLTTINCPILTIHGDKDSMVPFKISEKYGQPNPRSKFIRIKNGGHGYMDFNDEIGDSKISLKNKNFIIQEIINWTKQ
jgi:pimeloyl-ACP methyl ester carboxylesterase